MTDETILEDIRKAISNVEHPAIATTLMELGMLRDPEIGSDGKVKLTLVLPFPSIPDNVKDFMINGLTSAISSAGGQLADVKLILMNDMERQQFLIKEQMNWRS